MKKRKIIWGVVLIGVIGASVYGFDRHVKYVNGYCYAENRYLNDNELIDRVVWRLLEEDKNTRKNFSAEELSKYISYANLADFYHANPYCCTSTIKSKWNRRTFKTENYRAYSSVIKYRRLSSGENSFSYSGAFLDSCGERVSFDPLHHPSDGTVFPNTKPNRAEAN